MLDKGKGTRRFQQQITLAKAPVTIGNLGHAVLGAPVDVLTVPASVTQMSATSAAVTFQMADIVGLDIEFRNPNVEYNTIKWQGRIVNFAQPTNVDQRGRFIRIQGWYQIDDPLAAASPAE